MSAESPAITEQSIAITRPVGVVRVKEEYLCAAPLVVPRPHVTTPAGTPADSAAEGAVEAAKEKEKHRGQNKGSAREHVKFEGSGDKPTFDGEANFFQGDVLTRVKCVLRPVWHKRQREGEDDSFARAIAEGISAAAKPAVKPATDDSFSRAIAEGISAASKPSTEEAPPAAAPTPVVEPVAVSVSTAEAAEAPKKMEEEDPELLALRAKRKEELSTMVMPEKTTEDQKRQNAAKRDAMFRDKLVLAPLTTVGNLPYRRIVAEYGADVTVSEMAMVFNLIRTQKSEWSLLRRHESEGLFGLQVAVARPDDAMQFAKAIETSGFSYDFIDINCGCPVDLIVSRGCGCGLWEKKGKMREIVQNLVNYQSKPVTIKCRIGADETDPQLHKHIGDYESWGASAVTIHGRSRKQRYTKLADWSYIDQCSRLTNLPTIGNGDIMGPTDIAQHKADAPNISSFMLGRGALIKPWAFKEIKEGLTSDPSSSERYEMLQKFCKYGLAHWGADEKGVQTTRKFLLEWLSFLHRYVPTGVVDPENPQRINERPPSYKGRDELETLMASENVADWIKISEMLLGPSGDRFRFTPKHKSSSYSTSATGAPLANAEAESGVDQG